MRTRGGYDGGLSPVGSFGPGGGAALRGLPLRQARAVVGTPWSFALLLLFLLLLYSNAAVLVPELERLAPAQTVGLAALAVLFVERSIAHRPLKLAWPESHLLLAFLLLAVISAFTALWMRQAIDNVLTLVKFIAVYLLIANTVESWKRLRVVYGAMAIGGLFPAIGALLHYSRGELIEGRAGWIGIFANPNDLAFGLTAVFPLALALALERGGRLRWLFRGATAVYAAAVFLSFSRSGLLGFGVVVLLCLVRWTRPGLRLPALLLVATAASWALLSHWARQEGFADLVDDATVQQRFETIRIGLDVFADRPLLGAGIGCSALAWPLYAPAGADAEGWLHSHNTFVQLLSETGLFGTLTFVLLVAAALVKAHAIARRWRRAGRPDLHRLASALEIALWGFILCGLAGGYVLSWFPYLLLGLASALARLPDPPAAAWDAEEATVFDRAGTAALEEN